MIDPDFDPYNELMVCKHNTHELARAISHQSELLRELSNQHRDLVAIVRDSQHRIQQLETEVFILKSH
jgi:hypothetical protein